MSQPIRAMKCYGELPIRSAECRLPRNRETANARALRAVIDRILTKPYSSRSDAVGTANRIHRCRCRPCGSARTRPGASLLQRRHLLPQNEVFDHKVGSLPTHRPQRTGSEGDDEDEYTGACRRSFAFFGPELKQVVSP